MKFKYLGTGAAEGVPAIFCECDNCKISRERGGKYIRTRPQAIINDNLLIDLNADTYMHVLMHNINLGKIENCLITHNHSDHFYPKELEMRLKSYAILEKESTLTIYGSREIGKTMNDADTTEYAYNSVRSSNRIGFQEVFPFEPFIINEYKITPLLAIHDIKSGPLFYLISQGDINILYAHDTNYFDDSVWEWFSKNRTYLNFVSLDCTAGNIEKMGYVGHMNLNDNIKIKEKLISLGCADEKTVFCCSHFSHNGVDILFEDFEKIASKSGFLTAFDGMELEFPKRKVN